MVLVLGGCVSSEPDLSDVLFEPDRIIEVDIQLPQASWDDLRTQTRGDFFTLFGGANCLDQPFLSPFTYFDATVTVDGQTVDGVGVRKKGFLGSLSDTKPSLKIKFTHNDPNLRVSGLRRMTLNNARQDASFIKQCVGYDLLAQAGLPASRCNFAHVTVNGTDLGVYVHVDSIKKPFIARHFADDSGNLYEGTISDFRPEWRGTFEKKTNEISLDESDVDAVVAAMMSDDASLVSALEPLIDIDQFINFWVMEVMIGHWDGYAGNNNNFYIYHDPSSDRFHFIPWGIDGILAERPNQLNSVFGAGEIARRLYNIPSTQAQYVQGMREGLDELWNEPAILAEIDRMEALIAPLADTGPEFADSIANVRAFVSGRRLAIISELDAGPPALTNGPREPFCIVEIGSVDGSFSTTWGTIAGDAFASGTGLMNATINGTTLTPLQTGSRSGFNPDQLAQGQVQLFSQTSATEFWILGFNMRPGLIVPGTVALDFGNAGIVARFDTATQGFELVGYVMQGEISFSAAATTDTAPVIGTFTGTVIEPF